MADTIFTVGDEIRVSVRFKDDSDVYVDPDSFDNTLIKTVNGTSTSETITLTKVDVGRYYYDLTFAEVGNYDINIKGVFNLTNDQLIVHSFVVVAAGTVVDEAPILGDDYIFKFAAGLSNIWVDPEELVAIFPDVTLLDAALAIKRATEQLKQLTGWTVIGDVDTVLAFDYIRYQAACFLSRETGSMGDFDASNIRLGDLSVSFGSPKGSGATNRGNIGSWCELAQVVKEEFMRSKVNKPRSAIKAGKYANPMPDRTMYDKESRRSVSWDDIRDNAKRKSLMD